MHSFLNPEGTSPTDTLIIASSDSFQTSGLNICERLHVGFNSGSVWYFVPGPVVRQHCVQGLFEGWGWGGTQP